MSTPAIQKLSPRPFLKWAGGKNQLISQYRDYFPEEFQTYYEPFLGGGAVFFHLLPQAAILSDINPELVNAYCCVKDKVDQMIPLLEEHQRQHSEDYYYQVRSHKYHSAVERAARLIYLNKTCFNGLYRENSKGEFNVPIGRYKKPTISAPDLLYTVSESLQFAKIEVRRFEAILEYAKTHQDFVYFDPPYHPLSQTSNFTAYSRNSFTEDDQIRLRDIFIELARRGVKVMLSNSDSPLINSLYQDFKIHRISATRFINSNSQKRGKISEILVTSYTY